MAQIKALKAKAINQELLSLHALKPHTHKAYMYCSVFTSSYINMTEQHSNSWRPMMIYANISQYSYESASTNIIWIRNCSTQRPTGVTCSAG